MSLIRILAFILGCLATNLVSAVCSEATHTLMQIRPVNCQAFTLGPNQINDQTEESIGLKGTLLTAILVEAKVVVAHYVSALEVEPGFEFVKGQTASFFLSGEPEKVCSEAREKENAWYVTISPCCDTVPAGGVCILPPSVPILFLEDSPGGWKPHN